MSLARRFVGPLLTTVLTSPATRDVRRRLAELFSRLRREPHRVHYFHQVDDPYSHLAAQALRRFRDAYEIHLEPHLVGPPSDAAAPERRRLVDYSRKDAADVAPFYRLEFTDAGTQPAPELVDLANRLLAARLRDGSFPELAVRIGTALWKEDRAALDDVVRESGSADAERTARSLAEGDRLREARGHYLGATFWYGGEWYWGVDRLHYLERRLAGLGARRGDAPVIQRRESAAGGVTAPSRDLRLEFFLSLRSPYSYVAMERVFALPKRYRLELVLRPVLPMVMRGLPVPRAKRLYILLDTKREAERTGVPFGTVADPVGRPIERAFSMFPWAREVGRAPEYLHSFAKAAFADGIDTGSDPGLRKVVERAGLSWGEAKRVLDGEGWREELEENRSAMFDTGLWGVPSFRLTGGALPPFATWGQDRIWVVEEEIRKRLG
ncbi:MAG: DsbA family protein [Candidatus Binatia bacterium]